MSRCPNCRRPVDDTAQVCDFCDEPLNQEQPAQGPGDPRRDKRPPDTRDPHQPRQDRQQESQQSQPVGNKQSRTAERGEQRPARSRNEPAPARRDSRSGQSTYGNRDGPSDPAPTASTGHSSRQGPQQADPTVEQSGQHQGTSAPSSAPTQESTVGNARHQESKDTPGEVNINGIAWWIGWRPGPVIFGFGLLGLVLAFAFLNSTGDPDANVVVVFCLLGLILGSIFYYWGTNEINSKYVPLRNNFVERSRGRAEDKSGLTAADYSLSYSFKAKAGSGPIFVDAYKRYITSYGFLTDVSLDLDLGSTYNMVERTQDQRGSQRQVFYDNMEDIKTNDRGNNTQIVILTSAGDDVSFMSGDQREAEKFQRDLKKKLRGVRRQQQY